MPDTQQQPTGLEDLIALASQAYPTELRDARMQPVDYQATAKFKDDEANMAKLTEMAELGEGEHIADAAVRGRNVTFVVLDAEGAPSYGFFPLDDVKSPGGSDNGHVAGGRPLQTIRGSVPHGTASVPSVDQPDGAKPLGVPADIDDMNASETVKLMKEPTEGIDPVAIARYEQGQSAPRAAVMKAAGELGLLEPPA